MSGPMTRATTTNTTARSTMSASGATGKRAREVYVTGLRNMHAVENQAIEMMERLSSRLESYPEITRHLNQHLTESKEEERRLEELLRSLGTSESMVKDTVLSFAGNMAAMGHAGAADEVLKQIMAAFAFEQYEVAGYKCLLTLAEATGHTAALVPLRQSLAEEETMAAWL
ncbi:MAG: DUF892 family protein, partial [Acetobacteraceae bacterium]